MPRGVRNPIDYDAQIETLNEKITKTTNELSNLKSQRQDLIIRKQENEMKVFNEFLQENNLTIDDVIAKLTTKPKVELVRN